MHGIRKYFFEVRKEREEGLDGFEGKGEGK